MDNKYAAAGKVAVYGGSNGGERHLDVKFPQLLKAPTQVFSWPLVLNAHQKVSLALSFLLVVFMIYSRYVCCRKLLVASILIC